MRYSWRGAAAAAVALLIAAGLAAPRAAAAGRLPKAGETLPAFEIPAPPSEKARAYLGVGPGPFRLQDLAARLVVLEIIGVYCPQCYRQAPLFNTLFNRIEKGPLQGEVKMLAIAAGGNENEIRYLYEQVQYLFPVAADPRFEIHKLLGEPRTPFTLLVDRAGRVLSVHAGVVEEVDLFYKRISERVK